MKQIKIFKKFILSIVTSLIPVIIAACYGPYYAITGNVIDSESKEGLNGITVKCGVCFTQDADGNCTDIQDIAETKTNTSGYFEFMDNCSRLTAIDDNNLDLVKYEDKVVENDQYLSEITIEMDRAE